MLGVVHGTRDCILYPGKGTVVLIRSAQTFYERIKLGDGWSHDRTYVERRQCRSVVQGGRLPSWDGLIAEEQDAYSREHVDLILAVAREHGLMGLEGFKLVTPVGDWMRFWAIEFPTFEGAEAWISAEMEPPYGRYGYYEYYLARRVRREGPDSRTAMPRAGAPSRIPILEADRGSFVVVAFDRWLPGADVVPTCERGDTEHDELMGAVGREHGLIRLDAYQLVAPQATWHRAWVVEFPELEGAEAWIEADMRPPHSRYRSRVYHLARKWRRSTSQAGLRGYSK